MQIASTTIKPNLIGAWASALCLIHCLTTPLLFVVQAGLVSHPQWWGFLDVLFLAISLFAIYYSSKTTTKNWMRFALWTSWLFLTLIVLNEKLSLFPLVEEAIYIPSVALVFFHLYNRKYCQCEDEECCSQN